MADIVRHAGRGSAPHRPTPSNQRLGTSGCDVDASQWEGAALEFADLGVVIPAGAGPLFCEAAKLLRGVRRRQDGTYYRRRVGWRAERQRVVIAHSDQDLRPRPDGRFEPVGTWRITDVELYKAEDVSRRVGSVPHQTPGGDYGQGGESIQAPQESNADDPALGRDEQDLRYLPPPVRDGVVRKVPSPVVASAVALQVSSDGRPTHHQVTALRLDPGQAIAVQGARQVGAMTWQVEQVRYRWSASGGALSQGGVQGKSLT